MEKKPAFNYNYQGPGANYLVDLPNLKAKGVKRVRLLIVDYTLTSTINAWKIICLYALSLGFDEVIFGLTSNPTQITDLNITTFNAARATFAGWCQAQHNPRLTLCGGNEEMYHHNGSISDAALRANENAQYDVLSAIYTDGPVTWSLANGEMFPYFGDGDQPGDYQSVNLYSYHHTATNSATHFNTNLSSAKAWFGDDVVVSEFGPDPDGYSDTYWVDKEFYADHFRNNLLDIIDHDIDIENAFVYNFIDSAFGCKGPNGKFRPWWYLLIGEKIPANVGMV